MTKDQIHDCLAPIWIQRPGARHPAQAGTGILIDDGFESIVVTAAHVVHEITPGCKVALPGHGGRLFPPQGKWFVSGMPRASLLELSDPLDVGVFFQTRADAKQLRDMFCPLRPDDLDASPLLSPGAVGVIAGFPEKKSDVEPNLNVFSQCVFAETCVVEPQRHPRKEFGADSHLFMDFNRRKGFAETETGKRVAICRPEGMSGGGIFLQHGENEWKLAGVLTDYHERKNVFGGTRVMTVISSLAPVFGSRWGQVIEGGKK